MSAPASARAPSQVNATYNLGLYHTPCANIRVNPYVLELVIDSVPVRMEIDTGASRSLISSEQWQELHQRVPRLTLETRDLPNLRTYSGEVIVPLGSVVVNVQNKESVRQLSVLVVPGKGPNLLGRDWLEAMNLDWTCVHKLDTPSDFLSPYQSLFEDGVGTISGVTAKFYVDETVRPVFCKPRPVPLALRTKVEAELDRLQQANVIEPVEFSEWAAPIVPILKSDGSVRICGDYKVTINQAVRVDQYPIPNISDLYAQLSGGQIYSKLDLSHAYQQVLLDVDSQVLTTINTHKGLYRYKRLCYGVSSAPGIFQRIMEQLLQGIPMTVAYLDDVLVTGRTAQEHETNLRTVLSRLQKAGVRLKQSKCEFHQKSVTYLGHVIDAARVFGAHRPVRL